MYRCFVILLDNYNVFKLMEMIIATLEMQLIHIVRQISPYSNQSLGLYELDKYFYLV